MKEELKNLHSYMLAISNHWSGRHSSKYVTLTTIIQNMAVDGMVSDSGFEVVKAMDKLGVCHVTTHILCELECIKMAHSMGAYDNN